MISAFRLVKRFDRRKGIKENSGEKNVIFILRIIWIGNLKEGTRSYETMAVNTFLHCLAYLPSLCSLIFDFPVQLDPPVSFQSFGNSHHPPPDPLFYRPMIWLLSIECVIKAMQKEISVLFHCCCLGKHAAGSILKLGGQTGCNLWLLGINCFNFDLILLHREVATDDKWAK